VDYNLPERFELEYVDSDNSRKRPVMIHRAPFGSMERFVAVLLEHCGGNLPLWLTTTQVKVLPISDKSQAYAESVMAALKKAGIRAEIDERAEKIGRKIRDAEVEKIPYMLVMGERDIEQNVINVRKHGEGDLGAFSLEEFINRIQSETQLAQ
ncbi:MAG: threonine--tRNA ligase, partial [Taibaiella sp.]|nr:threonine--tRNA ligase [Taibaiella sp.]